MAPGLITLSFKQKVHLLFTLLVVIPPTSIWNISRAVIRAWLQSLSLRASAWNGFTRSLMEHLTPRHLQAILPATIDIYRTWISSNKQIPNIKYETVTLNDGRTKILWLGRKDCERVVLFFHGGGYVMPLSKGHLDWMAYIRSEKFQNNEDFSVCILEYSLIPDHPYPAQVLQAIGALEHLLDSSHKPENIIIGGDSAGGHLCLSLLSFLYYPRSESVEVSKKLRSMGRLKGCFIVSPLLSLRLTTRSYQQKCSADVLSVTTVRDWGKLFTENTPWQEEINQDKGWGMALDVSEDWWEGIDIVDRVLVTGGQEEIFRDHIIQFIDTLRKKTRLDVETYISQDEAHDGPLMDFSARRPPSATSRIIKDWIASSFSS